MQPPSNQFYQFNGDNIDGAFVREAGAVLTTIRQARLRNDAQIASEDAKKKQMLAGKSPLLWFAPGERTPTCHLENKSCPCRFDDLIRALSHQWGRPVGRGNRAIAAKIAAALHKQNFNPLLSHTPLRDDATEVASFSNTALQRSVNIFGRNGCATQTVEWTPYGWVVLSISNMHYCTELNQNQCLLVFPRNFVSLESIQACKFNG